jgi:hypothetical protein
MIPLQSGFEQIPQEIREAGRSVRTGQHYADLVRHKGVTRHATAGGAGARASSWFPEYPCPGAVTVVDHPARSPSR